MASSSLKKNSALVCYVISEITRARNFEWIAAASRSWPNIRVAFVFLGRIEPPTALEIKRLNVDVYFIFLRGKCSWPSAFLHLLSLFFRIKPKVVHCHLHEANILGLTAASVFHRIRKIHTRHHSTLHHDYYPKGVIFDKYAGALSDRVISVSPVVSKVLIEKERLDRTKLIEIPHGFDLDLFATPSANQVDAFKKKFGLPNNKKIIGVASRFVAWKNVEIIIEAFSKILEEFPVHLLLLNAYGPDEEHINQKLSGLPINSYTKIVFTEEIAAAYGAMFCFVHAPIDEVSEAFGQVYVEALAAGVPSIFTLSGIAASFIRHEKNALVVPFDNSIAIQYQMKRLLTNDALRKRLIYEGHCSVNSVFSAAPMISKLLNLYQELAFRTNIDQT